MLTTAEVIWALEQTAEGITKSIKSTEGEGETGWETADRFQSRMEMTRERLWWIVRWLGNPYRPDFTDIPNFYTLDSTGRFWHDDDPQPEDDEETNEEGAEIA